MTIKQAKVICKEEIGRLPRCGMEVNLYEDNEKIIWLKNVSGTYKLRTYYKVKLWASS
jgi:hypothetical protein